MVLACVLWYRFTSAADAGDAEAVEGRYFWDGPTASRKQADGREMLLKYCCLKRDFSPCREQGRIILVFAPVVEQVDSQTFSSGLEMCGFMLGICKHRFLGEAPSL